MPAGLRNHAGGLDRFEAAVLAGFGVFSVWILAVDLWQVVAHGRVWTGTDGVYLADQLQYAAWVRDASHHLLVSNLFVLRPTPADYFHPGIVVSGGLAALGVAPWLALLVWKPVAVLAAFFAARRYVAANLTRGAERRAALVLALFFGSFTVVYGTAGMLGDLLPAFLSWGYEFGLLSVALVALALLAYQDARQTGGRRIRPGLLGAIACLLHPWQGELLIATVALAELWLWTARRPVAREVLLATATIVATGLPLVYFAVLGRSDVAWQLARMASKHSFPLWPVILALAPLLLAGALAYGRRPHTFLDAATRAWPVAALAVYVVSSSVLGATPLHAFQGITIPLGVLAVEGAVRLGGRRLAHGRAWAAAAVAAFTVPAVAYQLANATELVAPRSGTARFINRSERDALRYLRTDPAPGGVISRSYLGLLVPAATGRHTFVGNCLWSQPNCDGRLAAVRKLFTGGLRPASARSFVAGTGARFLLSDCRPAADLHRLLGTLIDSTVSFGCARVYVLRRAEPV